ncbi:MAG: transcriptional repressor NrdR [Candidatus Omnitrophica bacterium]|nr:transcriptional repressor NrdR [Candidatus Omnitrophota bacterium]
MKCPFCGQLSDKVVDSRISQEGDSIRRRRECQNCQKRYTTYEHVEEIPLMIIKKDARREPFDKNKILAGIRKACEKRPISVAAMEELADEVEREVYKKYKDEVMGRDIGQMVMARLHALDEIAYVRFASVYRQFKDVRQFMEEVEEFIKSRKNFQPAP